jgi:hypothetical protein
MAKHECLVCHTIFDSNPQNSKCTKVNIEPSEEAKLKGEQTILCGSQLFAIAPDSATSLGVTQSGSGNDNSRKKG